MESPISQNLHRELWRHRERRGWASHLVGKAAGHIIACAPELVQASFSEDLIASWETRDAFAVGGPQWELIETWDFLEICCGPNAPPTKACIAAGLRCGPIIDILLHGVWDVRSGRLVEWLIFLVGRRRVLFIHSGAPCTTFSIAPCPKHQTSSLPYGKDPSQQAIADGNPMFSGPRLYIHFVILLCVLDFETRYSMGIHEHPASACSWKLPPVERLFRPR